MSDEDPLLDPASGVLHNRLGVTDPGLLAQQEADIALVRFLGFTHEGGSVSDEPATWVDLPEGELWLPDWFESDDEGFGPFRNVWLLGWTTEDETKEVLTTERRILDELAGLDPPAFDEACRRIESPDDDELDDDPSTDLRGIEVGVAGLAYVLNHIGMATSASCRGHVTGSRPWASRPIVYLAAERPWAERLAEHVRTARCGLDSVESKLLYIWASRIQDMTALAASLWEDRTGFASLGPSSYQRHCAQELGEWSP